MRLASRSFRLVLASALIGGLAACTGRPQGVLVATHAPAPGASLVPLLVTTTRAPTPEPGEMWVACSDEAAVARFASRLAAALPPTVFLAIEGDLGAGKTTFVKKLATAVGIDPAEVTSPTFTLVQLHDVPLRADRELPPRLVHMDAYRLSGMDDLASIG